MSERNPLNGIPFRLSKKFYPLSRPHFHDIDIHIPLDALEEEYDFTLERQMIIKYDEFLQEKERLRIQYEEKCAQERKRQEELAIAEANAEAERLAQLSIESKEASPVVQEEGPITEVVSEEEQQNAKAEELTETQNRSIPNQIMEPRQPSHRNPLPFSKTPTTQSNHNSSGTQGSGKPITVSLSDFEADTANPFDSVELKSMNDKAELASIWGKVLQDQRNQSSFQQPINSSPPPQTMNYHVQQPLPQTRWVNNTSSNQQVVPNNSMYQYHALPVRPPCSPLPTATSLINNSTIVRPISSSIINSPTTTMESSQNSCNQPANHLLNGQLNTNPPHAPVISSSNSFTKLHFPFLTSYTQAGTRDRELDRALERSYHQHYHQQQQTSSSSVPSTTVIGTVGQNHGILHQQPVLSSSTSASNLQSIPNNYNHTSSTIDRSHNNLQNQTYNNFVVGHNYNWPLTTSHTPPYEYQQFQQPTKK